MSRLKGRRFPRSKPCPCESGKSYGECCWGKKFRWEYNGEGEVVRSTPLSEEVIPVLEEARSRFEEVFGRKQGSKDLVFFESLMESREDFWQNVKRIGQAANVREEILFAWRRSGLIVGEHSYDLMPNSEYEEWEEAVREYRRIKRRGADPDHVFTYLSSADYELFKNLKSRMDHLIIVTGSSIRDIQNLIRAVSSYSGS